MSVRTVTRSPADLVQMLTDARARTLALVEDLTDEQLIGPCLPMVNPLLWEIGHLAWFQEHWVLRHVGDEKPLLKNGDSLYDSARVPHDDRWRLPLPSRAETLKYMEQVSDRVLYRIASRQVNEEEIYFLHLVMFHEDMHGEAFVYTRQTLGYPPPRLESSSTATLSVGVNIGGAWRGDVE